MNKRDAKLYIAKNKPTRGDLARLVWRAAVEGVSGMSIVNPQFTKAQVLNMMLDVYDDVDDMRTDWTPSTLNCVREFGMMEDL